MSARRSRRRPRVGPAVAFALWALVPLAAQGADAEPLAPGVSVRVYDVADPLDRLLPLVAGQTPNVSFVAPRLDLDDDDFGLDDTFLVDVDAVLTIDEPGTWTLRLTSDDGSRLWLDGALVVDHDGLHGATPADAELELDAGPHGLRVRHFENGGGAVLRLSWRGPGDAEFEVVPGEALACRADEVRVTSPGSKAVVRPLRATRPGHGEPLVDVHPGFDLAPARPPDWEPRVGGLDWLSDGRLVVATWDADGAVWLLEGVAGDDPAAIGLTRFASGLAEPLGVAVVDDRVFVLQKQELTELVDLDGDDRADEYRCVAADWAVSPNFHEFAFGLVHVDGAFYANLAIAIDPGGRSTDPQVADRGAVLRIDAETGETERIAHGLRTPNGIGRGAAGRLYVTDNQGDWLPSSKLLAVREGAFYGSRAVLGDAAAALVVDPPVVWLPQGEIGNSPSQPAPLDVPPYAGQMLHGDVTHGGLKRVFVEEVDGVLQGAVFRFSQGLEAGVNRLSRGPDGALYVGGIGSTGNWGQTGKRRFGLERLRPNGRVVFDLLAVRAFGNGLELEFTRPLADGLGWDPDGYLVTQWRYEPTSTYGGPKLDVETLPVATASVSSDRRRVFLELDGLRDGRVVYVRVLDALRTERGLEHVRAADRLARAPDEESGAERRAAAFLGMRLWTSEAWYTMNRVPRVSKTPARLHRPAAPHALDDAERAAGWRLLFDGETTAGWRGYRAAEVPDGWEVVDGTLARTGPGGDLVTVEAFSDFELQLEWRLDTPGGNSGVFFHAREDRPYVWESAPEMQILDNAGHPDGLDPRTSAGANYALHGPPIDVTRPVGHWNRARLRVDGAHVEHWLNGRKIVEYELGSDDWRARVAASKFASMPDYGRARRGHIALQDHGDPVRFRRIAIRELPARDDR